MISSDPLKQIIDDILEFRKYLSERDYDEATFEFVCVYLLANQHLIKLMLDHVYKKMTEDQRLDLCKTDNSLFKPAAEDKFRTLAEYALGTANNFWKIQRVPNNRINDDLRDLVESLKFAEYSDKNYSGFWLFLQPITKYM